MFRQFVLAATTVVLIAGPAMAQTAAAPAVTAPAATAPAVAAPAATAPAAAAPVAKPATHAKTHKVSHHKKAAPQATTTTKS